VLVGIAVLVVGLLLLGVTVLTYRFLRRRVERIEQSSEPKADKIHRLQKLMLVTTFGSMLVFVVFAGLGGGLAGAAKHADPDVNAGGAALIVVGATIAGCAAIGLLIAPLRILRPAYGRLRDVDTRQPNKGRAMVVALVFIAVLLAVQVLVHYAVPLHGQWHRLGVAAAYFGSLIILSTVLSPLSLFAVKAEPLDAEQHRRLCALADKLGVRIRDIRAFPTRKRKIANAVQVGALPGLRYILVSDYLLDHMSEREVDAVVAHELGHARGRHVLIKVVSLGATWIVLEAASAALGSAALSGAANVAVVLFPFCFIAALLLVQGVLGVQLEKRADDAAARAVGADALAAALEKLGDLNDTKRRTGRGWSLITQHPGLEQRIRRLNVGADTHAPRQERASAAN
jgi:STE24 endopeptidase